MSEDEPWDPTTRTFLLRAKDWLEPIRYVHVRLSRAQAAKVDPSGLVNVALLKAWQQRKNCRATTAQEARSWVVTIYVHLVLDTLRLKYVSREMGAAPGNLADRPEAVGPFLDPALLAEKKEVEANVLHGLAQLPEPQRVVLTLYYLQGRPLAEVADLLNMSLNAVKKVAQRGREALRKLLLGAKP